MPYKKLILPELQKPKEKAEKLEPKIEPAEVVRVTPQTEEQKPIILTQTDPPGGWKRILLDEDPISVTDITKAFSEADVYSGNATAQYDNTVKAADPARSFEVSLIDCWNNSGADGTAGFRFGTGSLRFEKKISDKTGFLLNLVKTKWKGPVNTAFNIYSYEAAPAVSYTVFGELV